MGSKKKEKIKEKMGKLLAFATAIGLALIVETVGLGQYVASYLTTPPPQNIVWAETLAIVMTIVGLWSIYLARKNANEVR